MQVKEPVRLRMSRYRLLDEKETYKPVARSIPGKPLMKILIIRALDTTRNVFVLGKKPDANCMAIGILCLQWLMKA